jgi:TetR/AcrR family transcriptional repressor of nem operon
MGRPSKFNRDEAVIKVMNEIWEHGYEACSDRAIAEILGISRSSLYNAFGTRENLFVKVIEAYNGSGASEMFVIDETSSVLKVITEQVHKICKARVNDDLARGCLAINCLNELLGKNDRLGSIVSDVLSNNINFFEKLLAIAVERGEIKKCDLRIKALALQNLIIGLNVISKLIRNENELWATTKHSLQGLGLHSE